MNTALRVIIILAMMLPLSAGPATQELVLQGGLRLTAQASSGVVSVVAGGGIARTYEWDGRSLESGMVQRSNRWYGSLGIYDAAPSYGWPFSIFRACRGVSRTVVEEGQIHFAETRAAEEWIHRYAKALPTVWANDGLLVQWFVSPSREQLNVDVWQVCVSGRPTAQLAGANDGALRLSRIAGSGPVRHDCAVVSNDVVVETQKIWREHWRQADEWNARTKRLR